MTRTLKTLTGLKTLVLAIALLAGMAGGAGAQAVYTPPDQSAAVAGLNSQVAGLSGALPFSTLTPANLPHYRAKLAGVRVGTSDCVVVFLGDSTTFGQDGSGNGLAPSVNSYPARLVGLLNSFAPAQTGLGIPSVNGNGPFDGRWSPGTGWAQSTYGTAGKCSYHGASPSGNLVYTAGVLADTYDVFYLIYGGGGSGTITATGGTATAFNESSGSTAISHTTVTAGSASTGNTVTISGTGNVWIVGIQARRAAVKQILIGNMGAYGSTTSDHVADPQGFGSIPMLKAVAPDLTVISLSINDAGGSTPVGTVTANLQQLISTAQQTGDVVLMTMPPSQDTQHTTYEAQYVPAMAALAKQNNCGFIDLWGRFGGTYQSTFMSDNLHPNDLGYADWAEFIYKGLTSL